MIYIIHHDDADGYSAGALCYWYGIDENSDVTIICANYNMKFDFSNFTEDDYVYIVDYSLSPEDMKKLIDKVGDSITWIDHHISAIERLKDFNIYGVRANTVPSAAMLTWQHIFPFKQPPDIVKYISDFDTWTFKYGEKTKWVYSYIDSILPPIDSTIWYDLFNSEALSNDVLDLGKLLWERKISQWAEQAANKAFKINLDGVIGYAANISAPSFFYESLPQDDIGFYLNYSQNKNFTYSCSLLSGGNNPTKDPLDIGKPYGFRGHKGACGATVKNIEFIQGKNNIATCKITI